MAIACFSSLVKTITYSAGPGADKFFSNLGSSFLKKVSLRGFLPHDLFFDSGQYPKASHLGPDDLKTIGSICLHFSKIILASRLTSHCAHVQHRSSKK
jgi:hypothetical protein